MLKIKLASMMKILTLSAFFLSIHAIVPETSGTNSNQTSINPETSQTIMSPNLIISPSQDPESIKIGSEVSLICNISSAEMGQEIWWMKGETNFTGPRVEYSNSAAKVSITVESKNDTGIYTCVTRTTNGTSVNRTIFINISPEPGKITGEHNARVKLNNSAVLSCQVEGYPLTDLKWVKIDDAKGSKGLESLTNVMPINATHFTMTLNFTNVNRDDNGNYNCSANDYRGTISSQCNLTVIEAPEVQIDFIIAAGSSMVYLNWTVNDRNDRVKEYLIESMEIALKKWIPYSVEIGGENSSYVLKGFEKGATYKFRIRARNSVGTSLTSRDSNWIAMRKEDLKFVPKVSILKKTDDDDDNSTHSITIVWTEPPITERNYIHSYKVMASHMGNIEIKIRVTAEQANIYKFIDLKFDATSYQFNVSACSNYTQQCGDWSADKVDSYLKNNTEIKLEPTNNEIMCMALLQNTPTILFRN